VKLDSLQSQTFQSARRGSRKSCSRWPPSSLDVYAARAAHQGHAFSAPDAMYRQFEADFEFDETPDQEKAIEDVLADMQKQACPWIAWCAATSAYGKTEVCDCARGVQGGEVQEAGGAVLAHTVLAAQHLRTFSKRLADYPSRCGDW